MKNNFIKKARYKFFGLSILSLLIVMITVVGSIVGTNYYFAHREINTVLDSLEQNRGILNPQTAPVELVGKERGGHENLFQYRYFCLNIHDGVAEILNNHVVTLNEKEIKHEAVQVANRLPKKQGVVTYHGSEFAYRVMKYNDKNVFIFFLDQTPIMQRTRSLMFTSISLSLICILLFAIILLFISKRAVKPLEKAYYKQQQFITNASHELKTPLAVISANLEMQEIDTPDIVKSEWHQSSVNQVHRLNNLINHLITMTKLNEQQRLQLSKINFSNNVIDAVQSFQSMAKTNNLSLNSEVPSNLFINGEKHYVTELINILLDNAIKYCEENGNIFVKLQQTKNNNVILQVQNSFINKDNINFNNLFDRFYRGDKAHSHNKKKDGYGVGLSMAQDIVKALHGEIIVKYLNQNVLFTVIFDKAK